MAMLSCTSGAADSGKREASNGIDGMFAGAKALQDGKQYRNAIRAFGRCLEYSVSGKEDIDSTITVMTDAMVQILNCYQSLGEPDSCVAYFRGLQDKANDFVKTNCSRDILSLLGYSLSRTEDTKEAEKVMDLALNTTMVRPTPKRLFRDYAYGAAVFFPDADKQDKVVALSEKALEQAALDHNEAGAQWVYSMLGLLYKNSGKISESADMMSRAIQAAKDGGDYTGQVNAYTQLADLYLHFHIPAYADSVACRALSPELMSKCSHPVIKGLAYYTKAKVKNELGQADSALVCCASADSLYKNLPYNSGKADIDCLSGTILASSANEDEYKEGMKRLERASTYGINMNKATAFYNRAKGYMRHGNTRDGEAMLDSMYVLCNNRGSWPVYIPGAYEYALNHYLSTGNTAMTRRYARALLNEEKFYSDKNTIQKLAGSIAKYQTEKKEKEIELTRSMLEMTRMKTHRKMTLGTSFILILLIIIAFQVQHYRLRKKQFSTSLLMLSENLASISNEKALIQRHLEESAAKTSAAITNPAEELTPQVLKTDGEIVFRQKFNELHPYLLPNLKAVAPNIGRRDELLCMLIALGMDNFELEGMLGIAHRSVNMARYRLRQKLGLQTEVSLDDYIRKMIDKRPEA